MSTIKNTAQAPTAEPHDARVSAGQGEESDPTSIYSLRDDMVKLVAYTIVSIRRDAERVMPEGEGTIVVTDNMSGQAFATWMIARYIQKRLKGVKPDAKKKLEKELDTDRQYMRVYYVVSCRWPREPMKFEERQIAVLDQIRDSIEGKSGKSHPP